MDVDGIGKLGTGFFNGFNVGGEEARGKNS